jgi:DNA-directed RNA polymerase specialized sigma24 family protein
LADLGQFVAPRVGHLLDATIAELDDQHRIGFVRRDTDGLSVLETAEAINLTEIAVKMRLLLARLRLREWLTRSLGNEVTRVVASHSHG